MARRFPGGIGSVYSGKVKGERCLLTPPFVPAAPFRHGPCVWLEWEGWRYAPADVPGAAGDIALWTGWYDALWGDRPKPSQFEGFQRKIYLQGYAEALRGDFCLGYCPRVQEGIAQRDLPRG